MLVIDDAHWADRPSLEVVSYVARRVTDVPMLIVLAFRPDVPGAAADLLTLIGDGRFTRSVTLRPLTVAGSAELMRRTAPAASIEVCRRCHDAAHGNPWLVGELGHQVASHGPDSLSFPVGSGPQVRALAREVITRRLAALSPRDRAVSAAIAVLGERAQPHVVAAVAGMSLDDASAARDALAAAGLLGPDRRGLAHALIAAAILENLPRAEYRAASPRGGAHVAVGRSRRAISSPVTCCNPPRTATVPPRRCWRVRRSTPLDVARLTLPRHTCSGRSRSEAPADDRGQLLACARGRHLRRRSARGA